ncbi:hypothetical protein JTE90_026165 [Oedothorax gibbosus]|uniref:Serine/threonine-protein phosphatase PGAM5, mitochondrial n=1 Tax=Oedothorax gibbosus TaxID=931172 RepID=A0AAV6UGE4_9ARAC|nr:hypothetical protein JTE90_026165 [Oedothorax gibbosus]
MVSVGRHSRWLYAVAGSGVVLGLFSYFQSEKKVVHNAWTTNFEPSRKWDFNWDKRDYSHLINDKSNEDAKKVKPTARRHIFLIRHGQYEEQAESDDKRRLTATGRKQAELVGQRLKELKFNYTRMVRSTMLRAQETSNIILENFPDLPKEDCDLLKEGAPIPPEPPARNWEISDETFLKDGPRIEAAFKKHFHRADVDQKSDSYEIIVCHGNVIRYFILRLLQFPPEGWLRLQLGHCSITWVVIGPSGRAGVNAIGDVGFMPKELMTG